ncbi:MAG: hypothetical protein GF313_01750 [Caldithrix sp.]|nr:hypothetical protein [Caldithrix sp.]
MAFKWRKWNNILHRDIGYLAVGLTIIYAISGIAVNHIDQWNPNYVISQETIKIHIPENAKTGRIIDETTRQLNIEVPVESSFRPEPGRIRIFYTNQYTVDLNTKSGIGTIERVKERFLLYDFNFLHLNYAKKLWTYAADVYAVALLFLAVSGLFVLKGRKGFKGRGKWLTAIGIILPVIFLIIYK